MGKSSIEQLLMIIIFFTGFSLLVLVEDKWKFFEQSKQLSQTNSIGQQVFSDADSSNTLSKQQRCMNNIDRCASKSYRSLQTDNKLTSQPELIYWSTKRLAKFVHDAIGLKYYNSVKGYGLFVTSNIKAGEILFVETPLVKLKENLSPDTDGFIVMEGLHKAVKDGRNSYPEFSKIWDQMAVNKKVSKEIKASMAGFEHPGFEDLVKLNTNQFASISWRKPLGVWSLLSKINHGLPMNVAAIFGEEKDSYVCVVIAITDIAEGTELVTDYFLDWFDYNQDKITGVPLEVWLDARNSMATNLIRFKNSKKWMNILRTLGSKATSEKDKYKLAVKELYPNGIIGKAGGSKMEIVNGGSSDIANKIRDFVDTRQLFDVVAGDGKVPPDWTGPQFLKQAEKWRASRS